MGAIWEYAWAVMVEDYSHAGFARLTQQVPPPIYVPPGDQPPPPPPPPPIRDTGTITPAFGRRYSERHIAQSLSGGAPVAGADRIVTWRYSYDYGGEVGRGFCVDQDGVPVSQWSYGLLADRPILVDVPNIMLSPYIAGWKSINLRVTGAHDTGYKPWGVAGDALACGVPPREEGTATMLLQSVSDGAPVRDVNGTPVGWPHPDASGSFSAEMGLKVAPNPWPAWKVRVDHDVNRVLFHVEIVAYVSLTSATAPPPPPPGGTPGGGTGPAPPPPTLGAAALNGIVRP